MKFTFILVIKIIVLTLWIIIARATFPRIKIDQLVFMSWKEVLHLLICFFLFLQFCNFLGL